MIVKSLVCLENHTKNNLVAMVTYRGINLYQLNANFSTQKIHNIQNEFKKFSSIIFYISPLLNIHFVYNEISEN